MRWKGRKPLRSGTRTRKLAKETSFVPDGTRFGYYVRGMDVMKYRRNLRRRKNSPQEREEPRPAAAGWWTWTESYFSDKLFSPEFTVDKCRLGAGLSNRRSSRWWNHGWERKTTIVAPDASSLPNLSEQRFSNFPVSRIFRLHAVVYDCTPYNFANFDRIEITTTKLYRLKAFVSFDIIGFNEKIKEEGKFLKNFSLRLFVDLTSLPMDDEKHWTRFMDEEREEKERLEDAWRSKFGRICKKDVNWAKRSRVRYTEKIGS